MSAPSPKTVRRQDVIAEGWPAGYSVLIAPGSGGLHREGDGFSPASESLYEELEKRDIAVAYAVKTQKPDCLILLESADWWGPVLLVAQQVMVGNVSAGIYDALKSLLHRVKKAHDDDVQAHLDIEELEEETPSGRRHIKTTTLSGDPDTVLRGLALILHIEDIDDSSASSSSSD
jgi:hypothetical protein